MRPCLVNDNIASLFAFRLDSRKHISLNNCWVCVCEEIPSCNINPSLALSLWLRYADITHIFFICQHFFYGQFAPCVFALGCLYAFSSKLLANHMAHFYAVWNAYFWGAFVILSFY